MFDLFLFTIKILIYSSSWGVINFVCHSCAIYRSRVPKSAYLADLDFANVKMFPEDFRIHFCLGKYV